MVQVTNRSDNNLSVRRKRVAANGRLAIVGIARFLLNAGNGALNLGNHALALVVFAHASGNCAFKLVNRY